MPKLEIPFSQLMEVGLQILVSFLLLGPGQTVGGHNQI